MARCLSQTNVPRYNSFKYLRAKKAAKISGNLLRKARSIIVHRQQDAFDRKRRIDRSPQTHQRIEQFRHSLKRQVFALNRHQDRVGRSKRVQSQQVQRRWAIDQDKLVFVADAFDQGFQPVLALLRIDKLDRGSSKILIRRDQVQKFDLPVNDNALEGFV